jgi:hypothetical protein
VFIGNDFFENFKRLWGDGDDNENNKNRGTTESEDEAAGTMLITSIPGVFFVLDTKNKGVCLSLSRFFSRSHFQITLFY